MLNGLALDNFYFTKRPILKRKFNDFPDVKEQNIIKKQ